MKKYKLTKEEQWIEDHAHETVPASKKEFSIIKRSLEIKKKKLKEEELKLLLKSIDQARKIHSGKMKPSRVTKVL